MSVRSRLEERVNADGKQFEYRSPTRLGPLITRASYYICFLIRINENLFVCIINAVCNVFVFSF